MWFLILSKYLIVLYSPFFWWWWYEMIKCLHNEMKWGERHRPCNVVLGYYWPSDDISGGRPFACRSRLTVVDCWTETPESRTEGKGVLWYRGHPSWAVGEYAVFNTGIPISWEISQSHSSVAIYISWDSLLSGALDW